MGERIDEVRAWRSFDLVFTLARNTFPLIWLTLISLSRSNSPQQVQLQAKNDP